MSGFDPSNFNISIVNETARRAGEVILEVYARDFEVETKEDLSPLTEADRAANAVIMADLNKYFPDVPVISEENKEVPYEQRMDWEWFWLVDPLDGTKEFIKKNGEFTVNIALMRGKQPWAGVVFQPVTDTLYFATVNSGSWKRTGDGKEIALRGGPHYSNCDHVTVVASRSHLTPEVEQFVENLRDEGKAVEFLSAGSSLKLCLVAEGKATVYPRLGPTMEWDTAAAHAVALAAGCKVTEYESRKSLVYNKKNLLNPFFIVE